MYIYKYNVRLKVMHNAYYFVIHVNNKTYTPKRKGKYEKRRCWGLNPGLDRLRKVYSVINYRKESGVV